MSIWNKLFGGEEVAKSVVETGQMALRGVGTYIDERTFTEEEKSKAHADSVNSYLEWLKVTLSENSIRSVTRRILAWGITLEIFLLVNVCVAVTIWDHYHPRPEVDGAESVATEIVGIANAFNLGEALVAVLIAYFGVQWLRTHKGAK